MFEITDNREIVYVTEIVTPVQTAIERTFYTWEINFTIEYENGVLNIKTQKPFIDGFSTGELIMEKLALLLTINDSVPLEISTQNGVFSTQLEIEYSGTYIIKVVAKNYGCNPSILEVTI